MENHKEFFDSLDPTGCGWDSVPSFKKGQRIFIELEVVDPIWSRTLYKWLHSQYQMFGCEIQAICYQKPNIEVLDQITCRLEDLANEIKRIRSRDVLINENNE